jgi:hypothetical protein
MKIKAIAGVLAKRFDVASLRTSCRAPDAR